MKLIFCRANDPISWYVRLLTWSKWSHVGIVDGPNVVEAYFPYVRVSKLSDVIRAHSRVAFKDLFCKNNQAALNAAISQIGKPYDMKALFGLPFNRNWQDDDSWYCSEIIAWAILQGGTTYFPDIHRVTPRDLWNLT